MPARRQDPGVFVTIEEAQLQMRCSRSTVFRLLRDGELRRIRIGRSAMIAVDDIQDLILRRLEAA